MGIHRGISGYTGIPGDKDIGRYGIDRDVWRCIGYIGMHRDTYMYISVYICVCVPLE